MKLKSLKGAFKLPKRRKTKNLYEGKLSFFIKKNLPDYACNNLITHACNMMNSLYNNGYEFNLFYLFSPKKTYEETPLGMFSIVPYGEYYAGGDNFVAYRFDIIVRSKTFDESVVDCFMDKLKPFLEETAPNIIGTVTRTDGKYTKTFYVYEALMKTDLIETIDNMINEECEDYYDDPEFKTGFVCALDLLKDYINRKKE